MNKKLLGCLAALLIATGAFGALGCSASGASGSSASGGSSGFDPTGRISIYSREDGSGTRGAFIELFGIEGKDANGGKVDMTATSASITNSTSVMMTSVASDANGIGYISLGSMNGMVKALKIDGVEATAATVKDGTYKIARPFTIAAKNGLSDVSRDFVDFIMSPAGQKIVEENGYIAVDNAAEEYSVSPQGGKIIVAGSSSVTPVMEKLAEAYKALNAEVAIEVQQSDSTTGMNMAIEGTCDIGMASRGLKESELSRGLDATVIAQDGIAVIVSTSVSLEGLSSEQVRAIYTGAATTWEDALA